MQVRKYEATTIKEAVDMVKKDLGPDAIILSTREAGRNSGKKVLITAAVEEATYQKKKVVEENLTQKEIQKMLSRPVREQREFINTVFDNLKSNIEERRHKIASRNYASIPDEGFYENEVPQRPQLPPQPAKKVIKPAPGALRLTSPQKAQIFKANEMPQLKERLREEADFKPVQLDASAVAKKRVKALAAEALKAKESLESTKTAASFDVNRIDDLKKEIKRLQNILKGVETFPPAATPNHFGAKLGVSATMSAMYEKLVGEGFEERMAAELMKNAEAQLKENAKKKGLPEAWVAKYIYSRTDIVRDPFQGRFHFFVGPNGSGKTSALVKMASHLVIKEKKRVAIITTDTHKVGASEQLKIYSQILNIPFAVWNGGQDLNAILRHMEGADYILFDTEGRSLLKMEEIEGLKNLIPPMLGSVRVHLVLSAAVRDEELYSSARRFKSVNYNDVILTNIDQIRRHGLLVNLQQQIRSPYMAFSMGSMIPEDFEWASKERVLDLILKISKSKSEGDRHE